MKKRRKVSKDASQERAHEGESASAVFGKEENPFYPALGVLIASTVFLSGEQNELTGAVHLPCVFWLLLVACLGIRSLLSGSSTERFRFSRLDGFVYGFFGLAILSILWNLLPGRGGSVRESLNMLSVWSLLIAAWFLFRQMLRSPGTFTAVFGILVALTISESFVGLYQQFVEIPEMKRQFAADPEGTVARADPGLVPGSADWNRLAIRLQTATPTGTFALSNTLGGFLACGLILLLGTLQSSGNPSSKSEAPDAETPGKRSGKILMICLVGVVSVCLAMTQCRSAYVALFLGILIWSVSPLRRRFKISGRFLAAAMVGMVVLAGLVGLTGSGKAFFSGARRSLGFRLEYWEASLGMIRDYPILGCGSGNFKHTYTKYKLPISSEEIADPHHFAVEIAATIGLPALLAFCGVFGFLILRNCGFFPNSYRFSPENGEPPENERPDCGDSVRNGIRSSRLFWGGLIGCWLAFFLSFTTGIVSGISAPIAASIAFPLVAWIYSPFARESRLTLRLPPFVIVIAIFVLLVHLSAAGGISVSSSILVLWILAVAATNPFDSSKIEAEPESKPETIRISPIPCCLVVLFAAGSIAGIYYFNLKPVQGALFSDLQLESETRIERRLELLRQSAATDPWSSRIRNRLVSELFPVWSATADGRLGEIGSQGEAGLRKEIKDNQQAVLELAPRSSALHFLAAERAHEMFRKTGEIEFRDFALTLYREAIDRYPNSASLRARYARALWEADLRKDAVEQGERAVALDDKMPHADQKLSTEQRTAILTLLSE